ncbi:hypothetical protein A2W24_00060 [Microgenomates group bacterium RBG_16_45_19]|nr:MAG: hypothetical protein A2W24_00060 [Microgenomates group bacterium RBG_16_45_19]
MYREDFLSIIYLIFTLIISLVLPLILLYPSVRLSINISKSKTKRWEKLVRVLSLTILNFVIACLVITMLFIVIGQPSEPYHFGAIIGWYFFAFIEFIIILGTNLIRVVE